MNKGLIIIVSGTFLAMGIFLFCRLALNRFLPLNPQEPYFLNDGRRLTGLNWYVGKFQPVFLWQYEKESALFLKAIYRDSETKLRFADVFVGGKLEDADYPPVPVKSGDSEATPKSGDRLSIDYFSDVSEKTEAGAREEICGRNENTENLCRKADWVKESQSKMMPDFSKGMDVMAGQFVVALDVNLLR